MTKLTTVVALPPMLSVAMRLAPSIWQAPAKPDTCRAASRTIRTPVAPTGCPAPISPPLELIGMPPAALDAAVLDCAPALPRRRDAEVIDGHVLGRREAVVRLNAIDLRDVRNAGALEGVLDRVAHMREHESAVGASAQLLFEAQVRGAMAPPRDARHGIERPPLPRSPVSRELRCKRGSPPLRRR